ncbi:MAG: hypothetical protein WBE26_17750 [Phycisphaerae bacterium]
MIRILADGPPVADSGARSNSRLDHQHVIEAKRDKFKAGGVPTTTGLPRQAP